MQELKKLEIKLAGAATGTEVFIEGNKIPRVRKLTLVHEVGRAPVLTLEVFALGGGNVAGMAQVEEKPVDGPADQSEASRR